MQDVSPRAKAKLKAWKSQALPVHKNYLRRITSSKWRDYQVTEREDIIDSQVAAGDMEAANATLSEMTTYSSF